MSENVIVGLNSAVCPYCARTVRIDKGRFQPHSTTAGARGETCPMQREYVPITGNSADSHEQRARLVAHLAWRMRDEDPVSVWRYLTVLPVAELQRLLIITLAAVPIDRPIDELFQWVTDLPSARFEKAAQ